jgi:PEP-CTERM motif
MKRMKPWLAGVGLCAVCSPALAVPIISLDFEGVDHLVPGQLQSFYSAVGVSIESASGVRDLNTPNHFDKLPLPDEVTNPPGDGTIMVFDNAKSVLTEPVATLTSTIAFDSFSFDYAASTQLFVEAWGASGLIGTRYTFDGNNDLELGKRNPACREQVLFCKWTIQADSASLGGTATMLKFYTLAPESFVNIDNVNLHISQPVPEPSTYALMALGLAGIAAISRRRRKET